MKTLTAEKVLYKYRDAMWNNILKSMEEYAKQKCAETIELTQQDLAKNKSNNENT